MARYIDADDLKKIIRANNWSNPAVPDVVCVIIDRSPSADVVPKSEVEKIIGKFECFLCHVTGGRLSKYTYDLRTMETVATDCINETYNDGYAEGGREVAMEFIDAVDRMLDLVCHMTGIEMTFFGKYAELKNKYEVKNESIHKNI